MIFTIGYQALVPEELARIATGLRAVVLDCRYKPVSRRPGFSGSQLRARLPERYRQEGHRLGGYGHTTADGIAFLRLLDTVQQAHHLNILLLCQEEVPVDCHRHHAICVPHFPQALHIFEDELIEAREVERAYRAASEHYTVFGSLAAEIKRLKSSAD
jgi:hypothetical protein